MQAIANSSYVPAKELGSHIPQFTTKGRLQVGMDADITVFDPETVKDNATWDDVAALNDGFHYTLVNGKFILKEQRDPSLTPCRDSRSGERQRGSRNRIQMPDTKKGNRIRSVHDSPGFACVGWDSTGSIGTHSPKGLRNRDESPSKLVGEEQPDRL